MATTVVTCQRCGTNAPAGPAPLGWSWANDQGRESWICGSCARENMRSIEAKLDDLWW